MPGKQDPSYFPLNLNMNGFYGEVGPILIPHRHPGKFDHPQIHQGSPIAMALHNSPVNATFLSENSLMSEYINMNVNNSLPPVNSEDEEEDDVVSQSSESVSVQGSDLDLDVEVMDDVDSLVLNIRDKLRMAPQFRTSHSAGDYCWTDSPNSATSTPNSIHSTSSTADPTDLLILPSTSGGSGGNKGQRKRHPSLNRSWRHSHPNPNKSYYRLHSHQSGSISKSKKQPSYQNHWWSSSRSFSDINKSRSKDAYHLLQELLQSGTLIKEAVRRLNRKCGSSNSNSNNSNCSNAVSSNSVSSSFNSQDPITPSNSAASLVVSTAKYSYSSMEDESSDNSTGFQHSHHPLAPCN